MLIQTKSMLFIREKETPTDSLSRSSKDLLKINKYEYPGGSVDVGNRTVTVSPGIKNRGGI